MGKVLFHIYLLMLEEKGFVRKIQEMSPFISLSRESHEGPSEQVWIYILKIKEVQLRPEQIGVTAAEEAGGGEVGTDSPGTTVSLLPPPAAGPRSLSMMGG